MTLAIILTAMICGTAVFLMIILSGDRGRDWPARDLDRALAKFYEARADLLRVEVAERQAVLCREASADRRDKDTRQRRRRATAAREAR